jgi:hypothetical protein
MISAIQPAGMVLIVKIILMLITGTCFVNGEYCGLRVAGCGTRDAVCESFDFGFGISDCNELQKLCVSTSAFRPPNFKFKSRAGHCAR